MANTTFNKTTVDPEYYKYSQYEDIGKSVGTTVASYINPIAGIAFAAGDLAADLIPKDQYGNYKNDFSAFIGNSLMPIDSFGEGFANLKNGKIGRGLAELLMPGTGGVLERKDHLKELDDLNKGETKITSVGAFNPLAGRVKGQTTGVNNIIDKQVVKTLNTGPGWGTVGKAVNLASNIANNSGTIKDMFKTSSPETTVNSVEGITDAITQNEATIARVENIKDPSIQAKIGDVMGVNTGVNDLSEVGAIKVPNTYEGGNALDVNKLNKIQEGWTNETSNINAQNINPAANTQKTDLFGSLDVSGLPSPINKIGAPSVQGLGKANDIWNIASNGLNTAMQYKTEEDKLKEKQKKSNINSYNLEGLSVGYPLMLGSEKLTY